MKPLLTIITGLPWVVLGAPFLGVLSWGGKLLLRKLRKGFSSLLGLHQIPFGTLAATTFSDPLSLFPVE